MGSRINEKTNSPKSFFLGKKLLAGEIKLRFKFIAMLESNRNVKTTLI